MAVASANDLNRPPVAPSYRERGGDWHDFRETSLGELAAMATSQAMTELRELRMAPSLGEAALDGFVKFYPPEFRRPPQEFGGEIAA